MGKEKQKRREVKGNKILSHLKETGMTQRELADKCGTNSAHISDIVTGKQRHVSLVTAVKIARALNKKVEDVFIV